MKKLSGLNKRIEILGLAASCLLLGACGGGGGGGSGDAVVAAAATSSVPGLGTAGCNSGYINLGNGCVYYSGNMATDCLASAGFLVNVSGVQTCRTSVLKPVLSTSSFPILRDQSPSDPAFDLGLPVYAGDRVAIQTSGGWGDLSANTSSWWIFTSYDPSKQCNEVSTAGIASGNFKLNGTSFTSGQQIYNGALPAGLTGMVLPSDGTFPTVFSIGTSFNQNVTQSGRLQVGFNVPYTSGSLCSTATISTIRVNRCVDYSGNTYTCF